MEAKAGKCRHGAFLVMPLIFAFCLLAAGILMWDAAYQKRLAKRIGVSKIDFVEGFAEFEVPADVAETVYDYYKGESVESSFQVSPDFSLTSVFRKCDEDIDYDLRKILTELRLRFPEESELREWRGPLENVRDVVSWVNWVKEKQRLNRVGC